MNFTSATVYLRSGYAMRRASWNDTEHGWYGFVLTAKENGMLQIQLASHPSGVLGQSDADLDELSLDQFGAEDWEIAFHLDEEA